MRGDPRRCQAENPLIPLSSFPEPTLSDPAHVVMPRVHKVASLLKRWLLGTLQGGIQHQHLDDYLDKFAFRFNRRTSKARGMLFYRLAQQAAAVEPAAIPPRHPPRRRQTRKATTPRAKCVKCIPTL